MTERRLRGGMTPAERELAGRLGAHVSWARTVDRPARTASAREAAAARFEKQVRAEHPDLPDKQVMQMAEHRRRAEMARIALRSVQARRQKRAAAGSTATAQEEDRADRPTSTG